MARQMWYLKEQSVERPGGCFFVGQNKTRRSWRAEKGDVYMEDNGFSYYSIAERSNIVNDNFREYCREKLRGRPALVLTHLKCFSAASSWRGLKWLVNHFRVPPGHAALLEAAFDNYHMDRAMEGETIEANT